MAAAAVGVVVGLGVAAALVVVMSIAIYIYKHTHVQMANTGFVKRLDRCRYRPMSRQRISGTAGSALGPSAVAR